MSDLGLLLKKRVDVVLLNSADPILEHQIHKYGKVLIDKNQKVRMAYELETRKKYFLISLISEYTADLKEAGQALRAVLPSC